MTEDPNRSLTMLAERGTARGASQVLEAARRMGAPDEDSSSSIVRNEMIAADTGDLEQLGRKRTERRWIRYAAAAMAAVSLVVAALVGLVDRSDSDTITDRLDISTEDPPATSTPGNTESSVAPPAPATALPAVRIVDDEPRNPESWVDDYGLPHDGFVPVEAGYGADGLPWVLYWVGLPSAIDDSPLPEAVTDAIGWGSLRIARCTDTSCSGLIEVSSDLLSTRWLERPDSLGVDVLADGSPIIALSEVLVVCNDARCDNPTERSFVELISDPLTPSTRPQIAVTGSDLPVIAYLTGATEAETLRVAVCADPLCTTRTDVVDIDQPVRGFELFIDGQGHPAVLYWRWHEQSTQLATCTDPTCSTAPNTVTLTEQMGNVTPVVRSDTDLAFWFATYRPGATAETQEAFMAEQVEATLIECLDSTCSQTRALPALDRLTSPPTNGEFAGGDALAIGPNAMPAFSWRSDDSGLETRTLVRCDDLACRTGTPTRIPAEADGVFTDILHIPSGEQIFVVGHLDSGLGLRFVHVARLDE